MCRRSASAWVLICLLQTVGPIAAQTIDDLFKTPDEIESGGPAPPGDARQEGDDPRSDSDRTEPPDQSVDIAALTTAPTTVSGSVTARGGVGVGWVEWPNTPAAGGRDVAALQDYHFLFASRASLSVDSRPASYLRFRSTLSSALNEKTLRYPTPGIDELFVDYTLGESLFLRGGKFEITWGHGQLLNNPANIVKPVADGVAIRASFPIGAVGANALIYSNQALAGSDGAQNWREFAFAGQLYGGIGPLVIEAAADWTYARAPRTTLGVTYAAGETTLSADAVYRWVYVDPSGVRRNGGWQALAHLFWENQPRTWSIMAEYQYDRFSTPGGTQQGALAIAAPHFGRRQWRPALRWRHAFTDRSGEVIPLLSGEVAPSLTMELTLPVIYGVPGSFYRKALTAQSTAAPGRNDDTVLIPIDNVVQLLCVVSLTFSF